MQKEQFCGTVPVESVSASCTSHSAEIAQGSDFSRIYQPHQERVRGNKGMVEKPHKGGSVVIWHFLFCIKLDNYCMLMCKD